MKISKANQPWYVADFETTGRNEYDKTGRTRVWLFSVADSDSNIAIDGDSIDKFMEWCATKNGSLIYFHNLRFDGMFILSWLFENGFKHQEKISAHDKKGFSTLIGDMGEFYSLRISFGPNKLVTIYDSLKLIPLPVRTIAKAFNLPIMKEVIDYDNYTIDEKTLSYVHNDVKIVAMALKFFRDKGYIRMTIGSNSYKSFMDSCGAFTLLFPKLEIDWIEEWREAYRGGRTQVNPKYANQIVKNVNRYDLNSMYPSIMAQKPLPYGKPIKIDKCGNFRFELYKVHIWFKLKKGHLPTLLRTGSVFLKAGDTYWIDSETTIELYISNIDLDLLKKHYDIYVLKFIEMYGFKTATGIFKAWIEVMYENKSKYDGGLRLVYKLLLNSLYGKFGTRPKSKCKIPTLGEENIVEFQLSEEQERGSYYLPVAIAITSWAHKIIDDAIMEVGYENFIYCDTDSVHTFAKLPDNMVDNKELGKFKLEGVEDISKYIRQKTYIYRQDGKWEITCAGMAYGIRDYLLERYGDNIINEFKIGLHVDEHSPGIKESQMKLMPKRVPGGVILEPVPFSLN